MREENVIFDFDLTMGTLVINWEEWRKGLHDLIIKFDPESNYMLEEVRHNTQNEFIEKYGPIFREKMNVYNQEIESTLVTDFLPNLKVVNFIKTTEKNMFIWSANSRTTINKFLYILGIRDKFMKIVTRDDTYYLKPNIEGFELIFDQKSSLEEYVMIGDSETDSVAAMNTGIRFIHVSSF